jgi:hypothetical protein
MADFANVSGQRVVSTSLSIPLYGLWVADVMLALATPLPTTSLMLSIGNLSLAGTVYRQSAFAGTVEARLVGGANGWSQNVQARGYNNPGGVLLSMVVGDAAKDVGEKVVVAVDQTLGNFYARSGDKASRVLGAVAGPYWWIDSTGVTHVGPRPTGAVASEFVVESFHGHTGELVISTEDYASWQPGVTFTNATVGTQTVACVRHEVKQNGHSTMKVLIS